MVLYYPISKFSYIIDTYTVVVGCIFRRPIQPGKNGLKLKVVLIWMDIYVEKIKLSNECVVLKYRES